MQFDKEDQILIKNSYLLKGSTVQKLLKRISKQELEQVKSSRGC